MLWPRLCRKQHLSTMVTYRFSWRSGYPFSAFQLLGPGRWELCLQRHWGLDWCCVLPRMPQPAGFQTSAITPRSASIRAKYPCTYCILISLLSLPPVLRQGLWQHSLASACQVALNSRSPASPPKCQDYRCISPHPLYGVLGFKHRQAHYQLNYNSALTFSLYPFIFNIVPA